jgi:hypothetical protein
MDIILNMTNYDLQGDILIVKYQGYEFWRCNIHISIWISQIVKFVQNINFLFKFKCQVKQSSLNI